MPKTVLLKKIKPSPPGAFPSGPVKLVYDEVPLHRVQPRFLGRTELKPLIDLSEYSCRAVIDWIEVRFELAGPTQWIWVQKEIAGVLGTRPFVNLEDRGTNTGTSFKVRFQEPELSLLDSCVESLEKKWGLAEPPCLSGLEVSIDFTPKAPSDEKRDRMFGVLVRHHLPVLDLGDRRGRPRFAWEKGQQGTRHVLAAMPADPKLNDQRLIWPELDTPAPTDATYYVGKDGDQVAWRIMDKVIDRQNPDGSRKELADYEKRTRIEVTLGPEELIGLGLRQLDQVRGFSFAKMQKRYFQFMLPTFGEHPGRRIPAVWIRHEGQRAEKFLRAGVLGLSAMDEAWQRQGKQVRSDVARRARAEGRKVRPKTRTGVGATGTLSAFGELNARVEAALRHLGERVAEGRA